MRQHTTFLWKRAFVRDVFTLQIGSVFSHGVGFLKSIIFARLLGLDGFGMYAVALSLTGTFKIFSGFGQEQSLLTYLAEEYKAGNEKGMQSVIKYFCTVSLFAGAVLLFFALSSPALAAFFYKEHSVEIGIMAMVGFAAFIMSLSHPLVIALLQIVREVWLMTILENVNQVLQLGFAVLFVFLGYGPLGLFLGLFVSNVIMTLVYAVQFFRLRKRYSIPSLRASLYSSVPISAFVRQGLWIAVDKNIVNFFPQAMLFIFSLFTSPNIVGIAQLALKTANLPSGLLFGQAVRMANSTLPSFKKEGITQLRRQCVLLVKHTLLFHALLVFGGIFVFPFLVVIAYGWEFSLVIVPMIYILFIRLLQPFNVANTSIIRLFRKVHISTAWNAVRIPLELGVFYILLRHVDVVDPLGAFVIAILLHQLGAFALNFYVYGVLLGISMPKKPVR